MIVNKIAKSEEMYLHNSSRIHVALQYGYYFLRTLSVTGLAIIN